MVKNGFMSTFLHFLKALNYKRLLILHIPLDLLVLSCLSSFSHIAHNFRFHRHVPHLWLIAVPRNYFIFFPPPSHFYVTCIMAQICCSPKKTLCCCGDCSKTRSFRVPRIVRIVSSATTQESSTHHLIMSVAGRKKKKIWGTILEETMLQSLELHLPLILQKGPFVFLN